MTENLKKKLIISEGKGGLSYSLLAFWLLRTSFSCSQGKTHNIRSWPKTDWREDWKEGSSFPDTFRM